MNKKDHSCTTRGIAENAKIPLATCWRELKELDYLGVAKYERTEDEIRRYGEVVGTKHNPEKDGWIISDLKYREAHYPILVSTNTSGTGEGIIDQAKDPLGLRALRVDLCF